MHQSLIPDCAHTEKHAKMIDFMHKLGGNLLLNSILQEIFLVTNCQILVTRRGPNLQ